MKVLVTGTAGFIGSHVAQVLLARGDTVIGFDSLNDYYDVTLKQARLARFIDHPNYIHVQADLADRAAVEQVFAQHKPGRVINLAAQAGVRYAAENPHVYVASNVTGFLHILEGCRHHGVEHLVYASTSSVYGANTNMPFSEHGSAEHPLTLYAATEKANEQMAHSYAHLYGIPSTGLRFFTVYGPWGRPDMALFLFTKAILDGKPIRVFNHGKHKRSFTYVDRRRRGACAGPRARQGSGMEQRKARSGDQRRRPVPPVQHRQRTAGGIAALHRGVGAVPGQEGRDGAAAAAGRRRAGYRGRCVRPDRQCRVSPGGAGGGGRGELRGLVSGLLRHMSAPGSWPSSQLRQRWPTR